MGFENFHSCDLPRFAEGMTNGVIWKCDECKKKYEAEVDIHWSHVSWNEIVDTQDREEILIVDSDLNKFVELYNSFEIEPYIENADGGVLVKVIVGHHGRKVVGYNYHYCAYLFDNDGVFVEQIIREE